MSILRKDS